jgi:hypothetical protein
VTDAEGHSAQVQANNMAYGTALEAPLGSSRRNEVLNEIRIPLTDFSGVDLTQIRKVSLIFGTTTVSGSIELANMRFQESVNAPTTDPVIGAAPTTPPQSDVALGSASTGSTPATAAPIATKEATPSVAKDAIPIDGTDSLISKTVCLDRTAPDAHVKALAYKRGVLTLSGWATDVGCKSVKKGQKSVAGSVSRVLVTVEHLQGKVCKYLGPDGKLSPKASCKSEYSLVAKGGVKFNLRTKAKLPAGKYKLVVQAVDKAGNLQRPQAITASVTNGKIRGGKA